MGRRLFRAGLCLLLGACTEGTDGVAGPTWIHLAEGFRPRPLAELCGPGVSVEADPDGAGGVLAAPVPAASWSPGPWAGTYRAPSPLPALGAETSLRRGGRPLERLATHHDGGPPPASALDAFFPRGHELFYVAADGEPPGELSLVSRIERGASEAATGRWRVPLGDYVGDGIPVLPGHAERFDLEVTRPATLRLYTAGHAFGRPAAGAPFPATFRVTVDGETVLEEEQEATLHARGRRHALELDPAPDGSPRRVRLTFEVDAPPGLYGFLSPVLGPRDPGHYDERPWGSDRPHVLLVSLDTFRADNLSAWGGDHGSAPNLDALAARGRRFLGAWSTAAWTLPAHASMLSGTYPPQHGAFRSRTPLSEDLETVVEVFRDAGYRTGAVIDSGLVSSPFGFAQGFEWFEESVERNLHRNVASARAFLEADDGRPVFLFLHTYRVHHPYRVGTDEDLGPWNELVGPLRERLARGELDVAGFERELVAHGPELLALYRRAVAGCDEVLAPFLHQVEDLGVLAPGLLVLTSDHGESFGEHGAIQHRKKLWEEQVRVPLLLVGEGILPGSVRAPASVVDLPRTLVGFAGLPAPRVWEGLDLLSLPLGEAGASGRSVAAYRSVDEEPPTLALRHGARKVFAPQAAEALRRGSFEAAYDLARDPHEEHPLAGDEAAWVAPFLEDELAEELARWATRLVDPGSITLPGDQVRNLRNLGYAGDEDPDED